MNLFPEQLSKNKKQKRIFKVCHSSKRYQIISSAEAHNRQQAVSSKLAGALVMVVEVQRMLVQRMLVEANREPEEAMQRCLYRASTVFGGSTWLN